MNVGGSITQLFNDAVGNLGSQIDPNANPATTHSHDVFDRLDATIDALANTTDYDYNVADQLVEVQAPNGATTLYEYDDLGNQTKETSPDRGVTTYTHDDAGNVLSTTDARLIVTTYQYDALNRFTGTSYPALGEDVAYTYDQGVGCGAAVGRLCQVVDASGTHTFNYDVWGNILVHARDTGAATLASQYVYDSLNRVIQMTYPSGLVIDYQRDAVGRVQSVESPASAQNEVIADLFEYQADGQVTSYHFGNGQVAQRNYDLQGWLNDQWLDPTQLTDYFYDANGNVTDRLDVDQQREFDYDVLDRLEGDDWLGGLASNDWLYEYDANGN